MDTSAPPQDDVPAHDAEPEQTFFADPALDRAVAMIMTLAAELYVTRDRLRSLEVVLQERGVLDVDALDRYRPEPGEQARLNAARQDYVGALMRCVLGEQASKGAPADLLQRFG